MKTTLVFSIVAATVAGIAPAAPAGNQIRPAGSCGPNSVNKCVVAAPVAQDVPRAFLCYSHFQVDPGQWDIEQAKDLLASGYWRPFAETTVPTLTRLATGVYLDCQGVASGGVVGGDGTVVDGASWTANTPGFYPVG